jgi:hypothetical protein
VDHELGSPAREGRIIGYNTPGVLLALRGVAEQGLTEFVHHQEGPLEGLRARMGAFLGLLEGVLAVEGLPLAWYVAEGKMAWRLSRSFSSCSFSLLRRNPLPRTMSDFARSFFEYSR